MKFSLIPREAAFFDWFEKASANLYDASKLLQDLVENYGSAELKLHALTEREHEGDFILHEIVRRLNKTFITPLDREDIHRLISALDDVMDSIEAAADAMVLYKIAEPTPEARQLVDIIAKSTAQIHAAMPYLRDRGQMKKILDHIVEINRLENEADKLLRAAMARLLERPDQVFELMRWKEIYEQLEAATDRCEDVSDVLESVVIKHG